MTRRKPRSYTYRIPLDDRAALWRIRRFERSHPDYWITQLHKSKVPTGRSVRNWACLFYQSTEHFDYERNEMVGGTIPGLSEYRFSLDWEPYPERGRLEMKRGSGGGTRIRGERFIGTHDPRLSDYVHIDTVVPWTPGEIKKIHDGEPVPDRMNYSHDPPMIPASDALGDLGDELYWAEQDAFEEAKKALYEYEQECDHDHVIEDEKRTGDDARILSDVAYCEDCGRQWDLAEFEADREAGDLTVVATE